MLEWLGRRIRFPSPQAVTKFKREAMAINPKVQTEILNGYEQFFKIFPEEDFINFGLKNIVTADTAVARSGWTELCDRIDRQSADLYVRDMGRNGNANELLGQLYSKVFNLRINYDQTNNSQPSMLIQKLTGYRKNKNIFNYQISHVFGKTKNVYCFTAPWNIVFLPKIVDPLTGHEAKGKFVEDFSKRFQSLIYDKFTAEIDEFNKRMKDIRPRITNWVEEAVPERDREKYLKEFEEIRI